MRKVNRTIHELLKDRVRTTRRLTELSSSRAHYASQTGGVIKLLISAPGLLEFWKKRISNRTSRHYRLPWRYDAVCQDSSTFPWFVIISRTVSYITLYYRDTSFSLEQKRELLET
ncbi:hypothetical protein C8Q74DRAFT_1233030 [Fomes fomentarius]|nr:hypothetical protein C8Q74DRAFT_1233030 [Fomes fomentarius]